MTNKIAELSEEHWTCIGKCNSEMFVVLLTACGLLGCILDTRHIGKCNREVFVVLSTDGVCVLNTRHIGK